MPKLVQREARLLVPKITCYISLLFGDGDEVEHLHDPPFLKYIPHLWPGGGDKRISVF